MRGGTSAEASARGGGLVAWALAAGLVAAVALAYANALGNDFVFDDFLLIVDQPGVRVPLAEGWSGLGYRPLRMLSYRLDYALGGMEPWVFHLGNVVYHAVTTLLVAGALRALGTSVWAAAAGALIFAVHPVQTDAVTYASGRRDVLCGLFFVAGFLAYRRHRAGGSWAALVLAAGAWCLALLAKEMAVTLPVVCVLADLLDRRRAPRAAAGRGRGARLAVGVALIAGVGAVVLATTSYLPFLERTLARTPWHGGGIEGNFATVARIWLHYLGLVLWPATLAADYRAGAFRVSTGFHDPAALAALAVLALVAVAGWWLWRRGRLAGLGLAWIAVTLLPVSHLVPYVELLAEHYLYMPMVGVALIVADAVDAAARVPARRPVAAAVVLAVAAALTARTVVRNRDWRDGVTLWEATVAAVPEGARARFNLGEAYLREGRFADAARAWDEGAARYPRAVPFRMALAKLAYREGDYERAYAGIKRVLRLEPDDAGALTLAGWISLHGGYHPRRARAFFDAALARLPIARAGEAAIGRARAQQALDDAARPAAGERPS